MASITDVKTRLPLHVTPDFQKSNNSPYGIGLLWAGIIIVEIDRSDSLALPFKAEFLRLFPI
jgi:hypothetical protein